MGDHSRGTSICHSSCPMSHSFCVTVPLQNWQRMRRNRHSKFTTPHPFDDALSTRLHLYVAPWLRHLPHERQRHRGHNESQERPAILSDEPRSATPLQIAIQLVVARDMKLLKIHGVNDSRAAQPPAWRPLQCAALGGCASCECARSPRSYRDAVRHHARCGLRSEPW